MSGSDDEIEVIEEIRTKKPTRIIRPSLLKPSFFRQNQKRNGVSITEKTSKRILKIVVKRDKRVEAALKQYLIWKETQPEEIFLSSDDEEKDPVFVPPKKILKLLPNPTYYKCTKCQSTGHQDLIVRCIECKKYWHAFCLKRKKVILPRLPWRCPECAHEHLIENLEDILDEFKRRYQKVRNREYRLNRNRYAELINYELPAIRKRAKVNYAENNDKEVSDSDDYVKSEEEDSDGDSESGETEESE